MDTSAVIEIINQADKILCVSHVDPDGDAVGSLLGMVWILRKLGKQPSAILQDAVPQELGWLPGAAEILASDRVDANYDLIICLDASSADRMGRIAQSSAHRALPLLVIDHHITNTLFGSHNWVAPRCAATCQMLVELVAALPIALDETLATCLLTGIVTDTLCFRTSNTTPAVLETALCLMQAGADLNQITQRTLDLRPFNALKLVGMVLEEAHLEEGVLWTGVTRQQLEVSGADPRQMNLSSILSRTLEADISAIFTEKEGAERQPLVECSFRAKPGFDVGRLALSLGGGGHPAASGVTLTGDLREVIARVVPLLQTVREQAMIQ